MWYYIIGFIVTCPFLMKKYLVYHHNTKMIEILKDLTHHENALKQPLIQKYTSDIIKLFE
jgi:hypothetical protein